MKYLCDAHRCKASEDLTNPGDYFIVDKRGLNDEEYQQALKLLKLKLEPKNIFSKLHWKIFVRKPVEETKEYMMGAAKILHRKNIWPSYRAALVACPHCRVPFAMKPDHKIEMDEPLTIDGELACPYGDQNKKIIIKNGKLYEPDN